MAVGGSGKTPMVEYLIHHLQKDYHIAVLSRGYGRKTKGFRWVEEVSVATESGDEPLQIKRKFKTIEVAVCEDRVYGVKQILKEKPDVNLVLLDDAFQHRAIKPSTQLLLSTYDSPFFRDWIMPVGRLRECRLGAKRADAIIYTKSPKGAKPYPWKNKPVFTTKIAYNTPEIDGKVFGFSGLANNEVFKEYLSNSYNLVAFKGFRDHCTFTNNDLDELIRLAEGATLVCTEKDWVKMKDLEKAEQLRFVPIQHTLSPGFDEWILSQLKQFES
ncbi:MAG: tetraacyldisaccharide 4-kinase [Bacteroidota bacterium]